MSTLGPVLLFFFAFSQKKMDDKHQTQFCFFLSFFLKAQETQPTPPSQAR